MADTHVFFLGATGFIGAAVFDLLYAKHPEYRFTALVRSNEKATEPINRYPLVHVVIGDANNTDLIQKESAKANIVINTIDADNLNAAKAIIQGLATRSIPSYYIHTSGTAVLADISLGKFGEYTTTKVYDDIDDLQQIKAFSDSHIHKPVDRVVFNAPDNVNTAIVCPPTIYGTNAAARLRVQQIPWLVDAILKRGEAFQVTEGLNSWDAVNVRDLAKIYLELAQSAAVGDHRAQWKQNGFYFAESQSYKWGDVAHAVAEIAYKKGFLASPDVKHLSVDEVTKIHPWGPLLWGSNCRSSASRVRKLFGWEPEYPSLWSSIEEYVVEGARANGLLK